MAWELFNGEGLGERHALHKCDNPGCCNPNHIYPGDALQNAKDAKERNRRETKLTQRDADLIRRLRTEGISCASIAKDFGISPNHVSRVAKGGAWG